jgi:nitrogen fixation/metabolism regulation signal transduction histidine kinase
MWDERAEDVTTNWNKFAAEMKKVNDNMVELKKMNASMVELKNMFRVFYASMMFIVLLFLVINSNCKC